MLHPEIDVPKKGRFVRGDSKMTVETFAAPFEMYELP